MAKRLSKTLWYGTGLDTYGKPLLPPVATNESDLNGLHRGELFMHLDKDNVTLWALSSNNEVVQIAGKQGEIDIDLSDYLLKSTWDKVWELRRDNNGVEYIYSKLPVVTRYGITMYADNGEVEVESIYAGLPIDRQTLIWKDGVLMVNPELDLGNGGGIDENELRDYLTRNDYAKKSDITTALNGYATTSSLNAVSTKLNDFLEGSDTDTVINKWKELETFLSGLTESDNLATILTGKADKSYVDTNFVTIAGTEDVTGLHNFVNGLKVGGLPITKKQDDVVYLDANLVVRGGITMYAENEVDIPSILDSLPIASNTALGIASFDSTYFSVDSNGMVSLTSAPSSGASTLGELLNVDASIDATASVDRVLYQPAGSAMWVSKPLSEIGGGGGSVSGNYLPLSGGTIVGSGDYNAIPLVIKNGIASFSGINICAYNTERVHLGYLGSLRGIRLENLINNYGFAILDDGTPSFYKCYSDGTSTKNTILHTGNYSSYALPLSGGTLTGDLTTSNGVRLFLNTGGDGIYIYNEGISFHNSSNNWVASNMGFYSDGSVSLCPVSGNVGIRTTSPSRELHVKGSMVTEGGSIEAFQSVDGIGKYAFIKINEYYTRGNEEWASYIVSDYYGTNWCTTGGFTHGMYFKSGRYQFDNFIFLDSQGNPVARLSSSNTGMGHHFMGNALFTGGITMYSDIRKKTKLQDVELSLKQIANAPLIEHYYNSDQNKTTHVGSIAQYWAGFNDWFCKLDSEGYYTMEIQNCALASAISIARHLKRYESKTDKTIRKMKQRIQELEDEVERLKNN